MTTSTFAQKSLLYPTATMLERRVPLSRANGAYVRENKNIFEVERGGMKDNWSYLKSQNNN